MNRKFGWLAASVAMLVLGGCVQNQPLIVNKVDASSLDGVWSGEYTCAQGITGLKLTLDGTPDGQVSGTFEFHPVARNPKLPTGSFTVRGTLDSAGRLKLNPDRWVKQVAGWNMVSLDGRLQGRQFEGVVPQCQNKPFSVIKGAVATPVPDTDTPVARPSQSGFFALYERASKPCDSTASSWERCLQKNGYDKFRKTATGIALTLASGDQLEIRNTKTAKYSYYSFTDSQFHVITYPYKITSGDYKGMMANDLVYVDVFTGQRFAAPEGGVYQPNPARTIMVDVSGPGEMTDNGIRFVDMKTGKQVQIYTPTDYPGEFLEARWLNNDSFDLSVDCQNRKMAYRIVRSGSKWIVPKMRSCN